MALREIPVGEKIIRQSIAIYQATIDDLCRRRNELAAMLPNAPRPMVPSHGYNGMEIKQGGGKRKKTAVRDEGK